MDKRESVKAPRQPMLDAPGIVLPETGPVFSFCFYAVVLFLAGTAAMGCFFTAFQPPMDLPSVLFIGGICALLCAGQFYLGRWKWLAILVLPIIWGIALWRGFGDASQGCLRVVNLMLEAYGEKLNLTLPVIPTTIAASMKCQRQITQFAFALQFPFYELLSWLVISRKSALGAFCLTGAFLLFPLAISIVPEFWALGLLFLFWAFLLFSAPVLRRRRQSAKDQSQLHVIETVFAQPSALLLLPVLALCVFGIYRAYPPETYERPAFVNDVRTELTGGMSLPAIFRDGTGGGGSRVDFRALGERHYTGKTDLWVKFDWKTLSEFVGNSPSFQKDYLKNFVGSVYTGDSWERLPSGEAALAQEALGAGKDSQTLYSELSVNLSCPKDYQSAYLLSVRKADGDPKAVYSPYGLYSPEGAPQGMELVGDGFLRPAGLFSAPGEYTLSATALPSDGVFLMDRVSWLISDESPIYEWGGMEGLTRSGVERLEYLDGQRDENGNVPHSAYDLWELPDWMREQLSGERSQAILDGTEAYSRFVYDHYTQLPEDTLEFAREYLEENHVLDGDSLMKKYMTGSDSSGSLHVSYSGGENVRIALDSDGHVRLDPSLREQFVELIREHLAATCSYTLSPPALPESRDFVEYFLEESHEGYCVHFASAAVVLLRAAGIPARYAEGYAVPVNQDGRWIDVPDYNAHAWVEVYWSGAGWLPMEVTPAGPDAPAAYANATTPEAEDLPSPTPSASPTPEPAESTPTPSPSPTTAPTPAASAPTAAPSPDGAGTENSGEGVDWLLILRVLLILLILPALLFLLWAQRKLRVSCRERTFRQQDRNRAALCVYAHLLRLYQERLIFSDETKPPAEIEELALKARFSNHTLAPEELQRLTGLADELEAELKQRLSKWERLRCEYLLALF